MTQPFWNIAYNIVGGLIVALLTIFVQWITRKLRCCAFRQIFGNDLANSYIVYPSYQSPSKDTTFPKPRSTVPRRSITTINLTKINSHASTRGVGHLSYAMGNCSPSLPQIRSDIELDQRMDISFVSVGGLNNYKSYDIFENPSNVFITFGRDGIQSRTLGKSIAKIEGKIDYGLILKIQPEHNPSRTWLCVAGIGEWGTSGASWWLSRHWRTIHKRVKDRPFACITKTIYGSDDSTSLVHLFSSQKEVEAVAEQTSNDRLQATARSGA